VTTLSQAPLLETVFQTRWAAPEPEDGHPHTALHTLLLGAAQREGFPVLEQINEAYTNVPHVPTWRLRPTEGDWPVLQIGVGVLTVNQGREGYDWKRFKAATLSAFEMLLRTRLLEADAAPFVGLELTYFDGFPFEGGETIEQFLRKKMWLRFGTPTEFLKREGLKPAIKSARLAFELDSTEPEGVLTIEVRDSSFSSGGGLLMQTVVRSLGERMSYTADGVSNWLEAAHELQRHAFKTLIQPTYMRSFE
jgi:uncharacterized protein (TIGR04255 family)